MGLRGRPALPKGQRRSHRLWLRLTEAEQATIRANAQAAGLPLAEYLRRAATGRVIRARVDGEVCSQLRRIGNNLNQVARALNSGMAVDSGEVRRVLQHVDEALFRYLP